MKTVLSAALVAMIAISGCQKPKNGYYTYEVDNTTSVAEWKGSAPDHFHIGSFQVNGFVKAAPNGTIKEGKFTIPIASIRDFDLPDGVKEELLTHLQSADFFNMALYPNAVFEITRMEGYSGHDGIAGANTLVTGKFTMTGQTHPITFPARIEYEGDVLKVAATLKIDRTKWGMTTYSDPNAEQYILPDADISLKVQALK